MTGEEWLVKKVGAYLPGAYEEVVDVVDAYVLTEKVRMIPVSHLVDNLSLGGREILCKQQLMVNF